ncbi:hypothetical protein B0H17DRAFT_1179939 [Mycena rosella]|uniref:Uncharacterized protein n=1 Tax=Mycena rosella TaxID=1033263 RepID=A0AAD7DF27_MYCRO|nr:hypothetical protein B0H17DRAFT_1179939 [Mycena rosella]
MLAPTPSEYAAAALGRQPHMSAKLLARVHPDCAAGPLHIPRASVSRRPCRSLSSQAREVRTHARRLWCAAPARRSPSRGDRKRGKKGIKGKSRNTPKYVSARTTWRGKRSDEERGNGTHLNADDAQAAGGSKWIETGDDSANERQDAAPSRRAEAFGLLDRDGNEPANAVKIWRGAAREGRHIDESIAARRLMRGGRLVSVWRGVYPSESQESPAHTLRRGGSERALSLGVAFLDGSSPFSSGTRRWSVEGEGPTGSRWNGVGESNRT